MAEKRDTNTRIERTKSTVLAETYRQLSRNGLANVSIDEISRASGVSKTTIYRHWPSRSALLIDACSRLGGAAESPDTGNLRGDLRALLSSLAEQLQEASWSTVVPSILDAAERDIDVRSMQAEWHKGLIRLYGPVIARAVEHGEARTATDVDDLIATTAGALFYRRWFSRSPIDVPFIDTVVDAAIAVIGQ